MTVESGSIAGKVGRGLGWSTFSNIILRVGNLFASIVMAHLIAPEQFGVFAVALTVWTIFGSIAEFGLGSDLIRARDVRRRIPTVATMGVLISGCLSAAMMLAATPLANAFQSPESAGVIRLMSVSLLIFGFSIVPAALLQRAFRQAALFVVNAVALAFSIATMTILALAGLGPVALAWGQLVSQLVTVFALFVVAQTIPRFGFDRTIARESASFCLPLAGANLISWLLLSVDNLVVARVTNPTDLGLYVLAFNVSSWPMNAVGQSIRVVALPAFSRLNSAVDRNRVLVRASGPVWAVGLLLGVLLSTLAVPIVRLLYGDRWESAAAALVGLAAFGALRVVFDLIATFLVSTGSTRSVLAVQVWWITILIPTMFLGLELFGISGAGWAHLVVGVAAVLPAYLLCLRRSGVNVRLFIQPWLIPTFAIIPTIIACWAVASNVSIPLVALAAGGGAAVALYVLPMAPWFIRQVRLLSSSLGVATSSE